MENNNNNPAGSEPQSTSAAPQYIGNYEVLRTIGKGKFAVVYRAHKIGDDQMVALKRISVDMMNEKAREKCLKEVRLLQNLDHPNIIRYMDSFITDNDLIIVYEWAAAGDLKRQLQKAKDKGVGFEERIIWKYFTEICLAIQHMHEKRIMHRDLKPANIFLSLNGTIKVGDLGLSRELSADTIQAHSKVGTPLYMSPEVLKGEGYDFKSDIWSLGCLLYELAMLKSPFKAEGLNMYSLFEKISNGEYPPLPDNYSEELRNLAYSMINIQPEDRPEINQVVEIAMRMRQKTANNRQSRQERSNGTPTPTSTTAAVTSSSIAETVETNDGLRPAMVPGGGLSRTPSKTALEAKEEALANPDSRSRESNPYGRRPDSEEEKFARRRLSSNEEKSDQSKQREYNDDKASGKTMGLDDYFQFRDKQDEQEQERQRARADSNQSRNRSDSFPDGKSAKNINISTTAPSVEMNYPPVLTPVPQPQQQAPSSSAVTQSNVVRRTKPSSKGSASDAKIPRPSSGRQPSFNMTDLDDVQQGDRSQVASRERAPSGSDTYLNKQSTNPDEISQAGLALALMEIVYAKLIVLGYSMDDPDIKLTTRESGGKGRLLPIHFTCDPKAFGSVAGCERGYVFNSLSRLIHIVTFLCEKINAQSLMAVQSIDREFGAPMTSAKQLLMAAQRAGEMDEQVSAITPTSISQGYGYNVCLLLNHFAECAFRATNFVVKLPVHMPRLGPLDVPMEEEDEIEDLEVMEGDEEDGHVDSEYNELAVSASGTLGSSRGKFYFAEMTNIDPELWRQETDRVTPLLRKHDTAISNVGGLSATWRTHLDMLLKHVQEVIMGQSSKPIKEPIFTTSNIGESISSLRSNIEDSLQKIRHSEKLLNSRASFTSFSLEYESYHKELEIIREKSAELNATVASHNSKLAEIEENLDEVVRQLEEKTSGEGGIGGNAPIIRLKEAIRNLQEELNQMHITTCLLNHDLLQRRKAAGNNRKSRRSSKKKLSKGENVDNEPFLEDDL